MPPFSSAHCRFESPGRVLLQLSAVLEGISYPFPKPVISMMYCVVGNREEEIQADFSIFSEYPLIYTDIFDPAQVFASTDHIHQFTFQRNRKFIDDRRIDKLAFGVVNPAFSILLGSVLPDTIPT